MAGFGDRIKRDNEEIVPIGEKIIIKVDPIEEKKQGLIIIPEIAQKQPCTGTIERIGNCVNLDDYPLKIGDKVVFTRYAGLDILADDELYKICMPEDIVGVIKKKEVIN